MTKVIEVVPYNPKWTEMFDTQAQLIKQALGKNCIAIHHIGSTAVPGLAAKPIIDIIPVVHDIVAVDTATKNMEKLGFVAKGEYGMLFRRYFQKEEFNIHVFEDGNPVIERHLKFRDWMRTHPEDRDAYAKLKEDLALQYPNDILSYCFAKDAFVASIDAKTGFNGLHIVKALTPREWESVRNFRQKYFFDKVPISDPYTWTFDHQDHLHFVLYQGAKIIGYAHIQLWPESRAALRIIVIDESLRNRGAGGEFLNRCERWLKQQGVRVLHTQSSPAAHPFYLKYSYTKMPFNDPDGHEGYPQDIDMGKML
ncbi:MAG: GNAT family N-acetyltransferase [Candidatus Berkiellales bacterium]